MTRRKTTLFNLVQWAAAATWTAFWISVSAVVGMLTFSREMPLVLARRIWGPGALRIGGGRLEVEPLPPVDFSRPHIFLLNHQSTIDIPAAFAVLPANIRFVAKHVLKYVPFLGWYMWMTGMVFVDRSNRVQAVRSLQRAGEQIRRGANILAFPEGTRSKDGRVHAFKKGPFMLAIEAGVPIIPVAIHGSNQVLPAAGWALRPAEVRVKVGMPIPTAGLTPADRDRLMRQVREAIIRLHLEIGGPGGSLEPKDERPEHPLEATG